MSTAIDRLRALDHAAYRVIAGISTPGLDRPLRVISDFANFSKPWFLTAAALAAVGGSRGRRAALSGLAAIGVTSFVVNQPMKLARRRLRPDRVGLGIPQTRWVRMPTSTSFPSGHSATAAAFAMSVGHLVPPLRLPLRLAAVAVAFSRVYTGVHYPGDVVFGATVGAVIGTVAGRIAPRILRTRSPLRNAL